MTENCSSFLFYGRKGEIQYQGQVLQQLIEQRSLHVESHSVLNPISMLENQLA
jgi:hypothetical protein